MLRTIAIAMALLLTGCMDQDPFGVTTRHIAGPYQLKQWDEGPVEYFIQGGPHQQFSDWAVDGSVLQIGWDRQHILVQREAFAGGDTAWVVVDVAARSVSRPLTESEARRLPGIAELRVMPAANAWKRL